MAARTCVATFSGHAADIWSVAWSPDGSLIASGSADLTLKLWSLAGGGLRATLRGHTARVRAVAWKPSGTMLASASLDQSVKIWDLAVLPLRPGQAPIDADASSGVCRATLAENTGPVNGVAWSSDGGELQTIALWSAARQECLALLYGYNSGVLALAFSPDGATLVSAGFDRSIRCWSAAGHTMRQRLAGHSGVVYSLAWSPDGTHLVSGSGGSDRSMRIWSLPSGAAVATLAEHPSPVTTVAWSADGRTIASGSLDGTVKLWSPLSPASLATLRGHSDGVRALAWHPDSTMLASASYDRTVRLWSVAARAASHTLIGHSGPVRSVAWSPDGRLVASGGADQTIRLWSVDGGACLAVLHGHGGEVVSVAFRPDRAVLASGSFDGTIRLWDVAAALEQNADAARLATLQPHAGVIYAVAWSAHGNAFASGSAEGVITLWDLPARRPIASLRGEAPYAGMLLDADTTGLADVQRATLHSLGALDTPRGSVTVPPISHLLTPNPQLPTPNSHFPTPISHLPYQPTPFIGRSEEIAQIIRRLNDPACRLLTLLGPGGIGKTRLALEVAAGLGGAFADGVVWVGLASVGAPAQIVSALGDALGLAFAGQPNLQMLLLNHVRTRNMLLVLDNFEHLLEGAELVAAIIQHAPHVTLLVTSRARLNLQSEWLFDVDGLDYPAVTTPHHRAEPAGYSAVQLFVQRATQVQPGFPLTEANFATAVGDRLCAA